MSYRHFKHNNIDYRMFLGNHKRSSYPSIEQGGGIESLDVLVMECQNWVAQKFLSIALNDPQYKHIFKEIPKRNPGLVVYNLDMDCPLPMSVASIAAEFAPSAIALQYGLKKSEPQNPTRRQAIKRITALALGAFGCGTHAAGFISGLTTGEHPAILSSAQGALSSLTSTPVGGLRDAIAAKIIEEYITPKEMQPGKALKVGILYGSGHAGIEHKIKHKWLRESVLWMYETLGYVNMKRADLNTIARITCKDGTFRCEDITIHLF